MIYQTLLQLATIALPDGHVNCLIVACRLSRQSENVLIGQSREENAYYVVGTLGGGRTRRTADEPDRARSAGGTEEVVLQDRMSPVLIA